MLVVVVISQYLFDRIQSQFMKNAYLSRELIYKFSLGTYAKMIYV